VELVLAMLRLGADVNSYPYFCEPPLPPEFLATLVEPWDYEAEVGIIVANPMRLERIAAHTIGITTWETTRIPPTDFGRSLSAVDEIIVPCKDNIALFKELAPDIPCSYSPEGVDTTFWSARPREWDAKPLKLCMFGALTYRKGIDIAVEAFAEAYGDNPDVELHIATTFYELPQFRTLPEQFSNIFVEFFGWKSREEVRDFYYDKHALFAPYRGEGFYLPGAEFMATGGILIAPDQMGAAAYHAVDKGWVIPSHWEPVKHWGTWHGADAERYGEWLAYDQDDVIRTLVDFVESSPSMKARKAENAIGQMPFLCDWDRHAQDVLDHVLAAYQGVPLGRG
jgi:glycosyltransferase involved in cell wall biosynthesis